MKQIHTGVLNALLSDCKRSDGDISKLVGASQPTVTRVRQRLVDNGTIKAYMAIPDYAKLGYEFGAITLVAGPLNLSLLSEHSPLVTASAIAGEGDYVLITLHRSMDNYKAFLKKVKAVSVVLFSTRGLEIKPVRLEA